MPKNETASTVKPHTEAKLQFYTRYLERYLEILLRANGVEQVNIYDMFCGEGIYSDGNTGSAVRAVDAIWKAESVNAGCKPINLHLNDLNEGKIEKIKSMLESRESSEKKFRISYSNREAFDLLNNIVDVFRNQNRTTRNLVFIDPYGYKSIRRDILESILGNGKTEVILFLPIEQMYRFRNMTNQELVEKSYLPLKEFIDQFRLEVTSIRSEKEFIQALTLAFGFNEDLYCTSYAIRNHSGHYYGMFFITPNLLGLEKIIEVKWGLDLQTGEEYSGHDQKDFFLEAEKHTDQELQLKYGLEGNSSTNVELYPFVLRLGFLPKHANAIFRRWQDIGVLEVYDLIMNKPARKGSFKINYKDYKSVIPLLKFRWNGGD